MAYPIQAGDVNMAREDPKTSAPPEITKPQISLIGEVAEATVECLRDNLADPEGDGPITIEVTTLGGDAEMARRAVLEIDSARERLKPRRLLFLGKTIVYSAGVTIMAGFPREDRFLSHDAVLLIHSRQLKKTLEIEGPLRPTVPMIKALLHQLECGIELEEQNFKRLIAGSKLTLDELLDRALYNWYVPAEEAVERGLVAGIVEV